MKVIPLSPELVARMNALANQPLGRRSVEFVRAQVEQHLAESREELLKMIPGRKPRR